MQQFNLDKWLQDKSRKVVTRDETPVRIVCWDSPNKGFPIVGFIDDNPTVFVWDTYGYALSGHRESNRDLFFAEEEDELTEFEQEIKNWMSEFLLGTEQPILNKTVKQAAKKVLDLAKKKQGENNHAYNEDDERIREALLEYFGEQCDMSNWNGIYGYEVYDWLEKQGEHKPTDKVETKFKVGDTLYRKGYEDHTVEEIRNDTYICKNEEGCESHISFSDEDDWKLKKINQNPAEWSEDEDERMRGELINAIKSSAQFCSCLKKHGFDIKKVLSWLENQAKIVGTIWYNNMDDLIADAMIDEINKSNMPESSKHNRVYWINSHREKHEWSEEDEKTIDEAVEKLEKYAEYVQGGNSKRYVLDLASRVESLRPKNHWKPSEYDISLLEEIAKNIRNNVRPFCSEVSSLEDLIENLKTL